MRNEDGVKWLTASRLIELLAMVPPDSRVIPNSVGNLLIRDSEGEHSIYYIDFICDGSLEHYDKA